MEHIGLHDFGATVSIQAVAWVLDFSESEGLDRLVLIAIANHYNNDELLARPSIRLIAREARISTNTVMAAVRRLSEIGELEVVDPGTQRSAARYGMPLVPTPKPVDKPPNQRLKSETQRRDQRLKGVSEVSHSDRDRTYNREPLKEGKPPCGDCGWRAAFLDYRGQVDEQGRTHPIRHSEALTEFARPKAVS